VKTMRSVPVTVPPENHTDAVSFGRFGSGGAYAGGHASEGAELGDGVGLGLDAAAVAEADGDAGSRLTVGALGRPDPVLHPATRAATTTHEVRTCRR
jgi:hypothetical protein